MGAFGCTACAVPAMAGFGVPAVDVEWNPYQGSPRANAEASYSFGGGIGLGDYAQAAQPFPSAPSARLNQQQAGIFRAFNDYVQLPYSGYGDLPGTTGFDLALSAAYGYGGWWSWRRAKMRKSTAWRVASAFCWLNAIASVARGPLERWRLFRGLELGLQRIFSPALASLPPVAPAPVAPPLVGADWWRDQFGTDEERQGSRV